MGEKGFHVSLLIIVLGIVTLAASLAMEWQHITLTALLPLFRVSIGLTSAETKIWEAARTYNQKESWKAMLDELKDVRHLSELRDDFCGFTSFAKQAVGTLCFNITMDHTCGFIVLTLLIVAILVESVGFGFLMYYYARAARKQYRLLALYILFTGAFVSALGILVYTIAILYSVNARLHVLRSFVYPGNGFILAFMGTIALSVAPCYSKYWKLKKREIVQSSNKVETKDASEGLMRPEQFYQRPQPSLIAQRGFASF